MKRPEWTDLHRKLKALGYELRRGGSGHWKVYNGKQLITVMPATTSDHRAIRNKRAELKRLGILV